MCSRAVVGAPCVEPGGGADRDDLRRAVCTEALDATSSDLRAVRVEYEVTGQGEGDVEDLIGVEVVHRLDRRGRPAADECVSLATVSVAAEVQVAGLRRLVTLAA